MTIESIDIVTGQPLDRTGRIRQSVQVILSTAINETVMRREFGSRWRERIDKNVTAVWLTDLYADCAAAILRWEPDYIVNGFEPVMLVPGNVTLRVYGTDALTGQSLTLENITP